MTIDTNAIITGLVVGGPVVLLSVASFIYNVRSGSAAKMDGMMEKIEVAINHKVDKENCAPAMRRIGKQIDDLDTVNDKQDESIRGLEVGMAFLVGKMGGDYNEIKRNGR